MSLPVQQGIISSFAKSSLFSHHEGSARLSPARSHRCGEGWRQNTAWHTCASSSRLSGLLCFVLVLQATACTTYPVWCKPMMWAACPSLLHHGAVTKSEMEKITGLAMWRFTLLRQKLAIIIWELPKALIPGCIVQVIDVIAMHWMSVFQYPKPGDF